ncbi:MAG: hypothetical protein FRX49_10869 [Trebouxia sp. A1-2]|nr:MAG: hypothetical protein FRX49_10869 [Trebouxia sp. A1-2]
MKRNGEKADQGCSLMASMVMRFLSSTTKMRFSSSSKRGDFKERDSQHASFSNLLTTNSHSGREPTPSGRGKPAGACCLSFYPEEVSGLIFTQKQA